MIKRNWKRIIASLILIVMFFPHTLCSAETLNSMQIGEILAQYAYNFCKMYGYNSANNMTYYDHDDGSVIDRPFGYRLQLHSGTAQRNLPPKESNYTNRYPMDCVGVVSTMIHQALGIGSADWTQFIAPGSPDMQWFTSVAGTPQKGDILSESGHVKIYIGDVGGAEGDIVEGVSEEWRGACLGSGYSGCTIYRIKDTLGITRDQCTTVPNASFLGAGAGIESEFYFNGIPNGEYSVVGSIWEILVTMLAEIFKLLVNLIFYIFRMVFVGFTAIVDNSISYVIKTIMGMPADFFKDATSGWRNDDESTDKVNVETIIFDDIFDVNFFKPVTP